MKTKILILTMIFQGTLFAATNPEINLQHIVISKAGEGKYKVSLKTSYEGLEPKIFADEKITLFNEKNIISGPIPKGQLKERDILFSGQNIDLDGDGKFNGEFNFSQKYGKIYLNGNEVYLTEKKIGRRTIFTPISPKGKAAIVKMGKTGIPFQIKNFKNNMSEVKMSILDKEKPLISTGNSCLLVEVLTSNSRANPSMKGLELHTGKISMTDPKLVNEAPLNRYWWVKDVNTKGGVDKRNFNLTGMPRHFKLTVTYLFAISPKVILFKRKSVYFNDK